jgi:hypothetical protein
MEDAPDVWAYRVVRARRPTAERYGILPWDTLPGIEQAASDYMNRERKLVEVIGLTQGGEWLEWDHGGQCVKWFLPCQQPPVPGA